MIVDKELQMLRDLYEVSYNEAVRLGYDLLTAMDSTDNIHHREAFFRKAARAKQARNDCNTAADRVSAYISERFGAGR